MTGLSKADIVEALGFLRENLRPILIVRILKLSKTPEEYDRFLRLTSANPNEMGEEDAAFFQKIGNRVVQASRKGQYLEQNRPFNSVIADLAAFRYPNSAFARAIGVEESTITRVITGERTLDASRLPAAQDALAEVVKDCVRILGASYAPSGNIVATCSDQNAQVSTSELYDLLASLISTNDLSEFFKDIDGVHGLTLKLDGMTIILDGGDDGVSAHEWEARAQYCKGQAQKLRGHSAGDVDAATHRYIKKLLPEESTDD